MLIEIESRFVPIKQSRKGSPRATSDVRAKVSHTSHQGRRVELFVTGPVLDALGWNLGGRVTPRIDVDHHAIQLSPAHKGLLLAPHSAKSKTVRLCLTGDFLRDGICAPVRAIPFHVTGSLLTVTLPLAWLKHRGYANVAPRDA